MSDGCNKCGTPLNAKTGYRKKTGEFRVTCKKCWAAYHAEWRRKNPERNAHNDQVWRAKNRDRCRGYNLKAGCKFYAYINELKKAPCLDCKNIFPPECMDFDHVRGTKKFNIGQTSCRKWADVLKEIDKCDLVCSNCHRIRTKKNWREQHPTQTK